MVITNQIFRVSQLTSGVKQKQNGAIMITTTNYFVVNQCIV